MNIRTKITFQFTLIVAAIILLLSGSIYYFSSNYRQSEFSERLKSRGINTAKLLVDVDEINSNLLNIIEKNSAYALAHEDVVIINASAEIIYCDCSDINPMRYISRNISKIWLDREVNFNDGHRDAIGFIFRGKHQRYIVVVTALDQFGLSKLRYLGLILVLGCFFTVSLVFIAGWLFAGQALKPVGLIASEADKITGS